MSKIPFDIKFRPQIESGEYKVETGSGVPVRILCTNAKGALPIIGNVGDDSENLQRWTEKGQYHVGLNTPDKDLFLVTPEPEMSELELAIAKYRPPTDSKETIQRIAAELLALARKQLQPEIDAEIEKAYKNADEV